ncbi:MarR family winged helix-turn-helix transcriptional regulator [Mesorhizobium sp. IMUNJ 23232]|uniref:MarR family winged helix-turn-helix transcriptional regulator n=1 Tax=Mesorhizobium sp. IMUNJ 23232 TaxID=3376064 RepID=UPI003796BB72
MTKAKTPSDEAIAAWARLHRVSRQFLETAEDALKAEGLPPLAWYDALHEIAQAGEDGMRPFQLIDRMLLAQYSVSRLLARLETEGLIEKLDVADDGRGQTVRITGQGRDLRRRMWSVYGKVIDEQLGSKLAADELLTLCVLLGRLRHPQSES